MTKDEMVELLKTDVKTWNRLKIKEAGLEGVILYKASLYGVILYKANLKGADLEKSCPKLKEIMDRNLKKLLV